MFKINARGEETVLYSFNGGADGGIATSALLMDKVGNLYGTTGYGGAYNSGTVFKLTKAGKEIVLYSFTGGADGAYPVTGLVRDANGNLYGTTGFGGDLSCFWNSLPGCGVVFKLDKAGHQTVLYTFTGGADGYYPISGVTLDTEGNLYGTAAFGGIFNGGVLFKISNVSEMKRPVGTFSGLHSFGSGSDGKTPFGGVSICSDGNVFGTTEFGGILGVGTLWKVDKNGNETVIHEFDLAEGGGEPSATEEWTQGGHGAVFYGTALGGRIKGNSGSGTVYSMDVDTEQRKCVP